MSADPTPPPDHDPAARFRKPAEPQGQAPAPQEPPPPRPYGLSQILEDTLTAPRRAGWLFETLAREPLPGYGLMAANLALYWLGALGINLLHVFISEPRALHYPPAMMGIAAGSALLVLVIASFLWAGALHVFVLLSGGSGGFGRSYQIVSMLSVLAPLQALLNWAPAAWPLPTLLGAYLAVRAVERLHQAPAARARAVFAGLAALALGAGWYSKIQFQRFRAQYQAMNQGMAGIRNMALQIQQIQQAGGLPQQPLRAQPGAASPAIQPADPLSGGQNQGTQDPSSGLGMISAPSPGGGPAPALDPSQVQAMRQASAGLISSLMPMLTNPALTKNMPPEQRKQMEEMTRMISSLQEDLQSGKPLTPRQRAEMMQRFQQMSLQMMMNLPKNQQGAPARGAPAPQDGQTQEGQP